VLNGAGGQEKKGKAQQSLLVPVSCLLCSTLTLQKRGASANKQSLFFSGVNLTATVQVCATLRLGH